METSIQVLSIHKAFFGHSLNFITHRNVDKYLEKAEQDYPDQINFFKSLTRFVHVVTYKGGECEGAQEPYLTKHDQHVQKGRKAEAWGRENAHHRAIVVIDCHIVEHKCCYDWTYQHV